MVEDIVLTRTDGHGRQARLNLSRARAVASSGIQRGYVQVRRRAAGSGQHPFLYLLALPAFLGISLGQRRAALASCGHAAGVRGRKAGPCGLTPIVPDEGYSAKIELAPQRCRIRDVVIETVCLFPSRLFRSNLIMSE
jgi:hypothetical protein